MHRAVTSGLPGFGNTCNHAYADLQPAIIPPHSFRSHFLSNTIQLERVVSQNLNTMNSRELIDAQFDRAVEIVQNLPKTGPIQTGYEEKLTMYRCATTSPIVPFPFP
jgi:hypothetical protein